MVLTVDVVLTVDGNEVIEIEAKVGPNVGGALGIEDNEGDEDFVGAEVNFGSCPKIKLKFCTFDTAFLPLDG